MMGIVSLYLAQDDGLTFREVVANVPHDTAAVVVYLLVGLSVGLIWWAHRNAGKEHRGFDRSTKLDADDPRPPGGGDRPRRPAA